VYFKENGVNMPVIYIASGLNFAAAITSIGGLYMWGNNSYGQLAVYERVEPELFYPQKVKLEEKCLMVACGLYHTCCIIQYFKVFSWGNNSSGQLGQGDLLPNYKPKEIKSLTGQCCSYVACGIDNSMAVTEDGRVYGWGNNAYYKMGLEKNPYKPEQINTGRNILIPIEFTINFSSYGKGNEYPKQLRLQKSYTMCLSSFDRYFWWGLTPTTDVSHWSRDELMRNQHNDPGRIYGIQMLLPEQELKKDDSQEGLFYIKKVAGKYLVESINFDEDKGVHEVKKQLYAKIACGENYTMALTFFGELLVWGSNLYGQHGTNPEDISKAYKEFFTTGMAQKTNPKFRIECFPHFVNQFSVSSNRKVTHFSCGSRHVLAVQNRTSVFAWGDNTYGQLGLGQGSTIKVGTPQRVLGVSGRSIKDCVAGDDISVVLTAEGQVFICGSNRDGKLGLGRKDKDNVMNFEPINSLHKVRVVAVGKNHLLAICEVEKLQRNIFDFLAESSEQRALEEEKGLEKENELKEKKNDDKKKEKKDNQTDLYAWGNGALGQLGLEKAENVNLPIKIEVKGDFTSVSAGDQHSGATTSDNKLYLWGNMDYLPGDIELQLRMSQGDDVKFKSVRGNTSFIKKPYEVKKKVDTTFILFSEVILGSRYNIALGGDSSNLGTYIYEWGSFLSKNGDENSRLTDIRVFANFTVKQVSLAYDHAAAISYDGQKVYTWGIDNFSGKLGASVEIVRNKKDSKKQKDAADIPTFDPMEVYYEAKEVKSLQELMVQRVDDIHNKRLAADMDDKLKLSVNKSSLAVSESTHDFSLNPDASTGPGSENNKIVSRQKPQNLLSDEYLDHLKLLAQQSYLSMVKLLEEYNNALEKRSLGIESLKNLLFCRLIEDPFSLPIRDPESLRAESLNNDQTMNVFISHTLTAFQLHPCLLVKLVEPALGKGRGKAALDPEEFADFIWEVYGNIQLDDRKEELYLVLFENLLQIELQGLMRFSEIFIFEDKALSTFYHADSNTPMRSIRYSVALLMRAIENSFDIGREIDAAYFKLFNEVSLKIKSLDSDLKNFAFVMWEIKEMSGRYKSDNQSWKVEEFLERIANIKKLTSIGLFSGFVRGRGRKGLVLNLLTRFHSVLMGHKELKDYKEKDQIRVMWGFLLYPLKQKIDNEIKKMDGKERPKLEYNLRHCFIFLMHYYTGTKFTLQSDEDSKEASKDSDKWTDKITEILFNNSDNFLNELRTNMRVMCQHENIFDKFIDPIEVAIEGRNKKQGLLGNNSNSDDKKNLDDEGAHIEEKEKIQKDKGKEYFKLDERQACTFRSFFMYIQQIYSHMPEKLSVKKSYLFKVFTHILEDTGLDSISIFQDVGNLNLVESKS
jgi:alpha-tubulin suppressor-like RCC1 family protein